MKDGQAQGRGERRSFDFGEVGERSDVEAEVHELQEDEEGLHEAVGGLREVFGGGEDAVEEAGFEGQGAGSWLSGLSGQGRGVGAGRCVPRERRSGSRGGRGFRRSRVGWRCRRGLRGCG